MKLVKNMAVLALITNSAHATIIKQRLLDSSVKTPEDSQNVGTEIESNTVMALVSKESNFLSMNDEEHQKA
jgi:hypothetical protein